MLERLIGALFDIELEPTPKELADMLWLATQVMEKREVHSKQQSHFKKKPKKSFNQRQQHNENKETLALEKGEKLENFKPVATPLYSKGASAPIGEKGPSVAFRSPATKALPNSLELLRALQPLKRRLPSRTHKVFDEQATIERIADGKIILPVLKPEYERWFELALVIDENPSMAIWQQTISEFYQVLQQSGAFRNVLLWGLATDKSGNVSLHEGASFRNTRCIRRDFKELIHPTGQRLVFLISDCVSAAWHTGKITRLIRQWGAYSSVTIVQLLPQRMWMGTALSHASLVYLSSSRLGSANRNLTVKSPYLLEDLSRNREIKDSIKVPIFTLEKDFLQLWSQFITNSQDSLVPGFLFPKKANCYPQNYLVNVENIKNESADYLLKRFYATASPTAKKLAGYLSATPLNLPIMRLVQRVMMRGSKQTYLEDLAEVFLSGLLNRVNEKPATNNLSQIDYDFVEGVRQRLLDDILVTDAVRVFREVTRFVNERAGQVLDFEALLSGNIKNGNGIKNDCKPFAVVAAQVLKRLGGVFAQIAEKLEQNNEHDNRFDLPYEHPKAHSKVDDNIARNKNTQKLPEKREITWLQISGLQFRPAHIENEQNRLSQLINMVREQTNNGTRFDLIFVTGDIASTGHTLEYRQATNFFDDLLAVAELDKERLFIVPGKHDLSLEPYPNIYYPKSDDELNEQLFGPEFPYKIREKNILGTRFSNFTNWFNSYFDGDRNFDFNSTCQQPEVINISNLKVGILPINSALFSFSDMDFGNLWVGRLPLSYATYLLNAQNPDIKIALLCHSPKSLHRSESLNVERKFIKNYHFLLHNNYREVVKINLEPNDGLITFNTVGINSRSENHIHSSSIFIIKANYDNSQISCNTIDYSDKHQWETSNKISIPFIRKAEPIMQLLSNKKLNKGIVSKLTTKTIYINLGHNLEGIAVRRAEFDKKVGDEILFALKYTEPAQGCLEFIYGKEILDLQWDLLEELYKNKSTVTGRVKHRNANGLIIDLDGINASMPREQLDLNPLVNLNYFINKKIEAKILRLGRKSSRIVLSRKALLEESHQAEEERFNSLKEGMVLAGKVNYCTNYGAFIDLDGVVGLLHNTEISWGRAPFPLDYFQPGQEINVKIKKIDKEKGRIGLTLKELLPNPWDNIHDRYAINSIVKGKVISIVEYGAFIELESGIEGLLHISEMSLPYSKYSKMVNPAKIVKVGQVIDVQIIKIDAKRHRISLSIRELLPNPWVLFAKNHSVGDIVQGRVKLLTNFGVFITVEEGIDGLVHISEISWKKVHHPSDVLKVGQVVNTLIIFLDEKSPRLGLSIKALKSKDTNLYFHKHI